MQLTAWELFKESGYTDTQTCHELFCKNLILHWIPEKAGDLTKDACLSFLDTTSWLSNLRSFYIIQISLHRITYRSPRFPKPSHVDDIPAVFLHTCPKEGIHRRRDPEFRLGWNFWGSFHQVQKVLGIFARIPPLIGNPFNGQYKPLLYYKVDDHPVFVYMENTKGFDPSTNGSFQTEYSFQHLLDESHNLIEKSPGAWGGNFWDTAKSDFLLSNLQLMPKDQPPIPSQTIRVGWSVDLSKKRTQLCYPNWQASPWRKFNWKVLVEPNGFSVPRKTWNWWSIQSEPFHTMVSVWNLQSWCSD